MGKNKEVLRLSKKNCWEFKNCGREFNGARVDELGVCPASIESALDGIHDGKNSGRACWVVAGSLCNGRLQESFAAKYNDCKECDFYKSVKIEEGLYLEMTIVMLNKLRKEGLQLNTVASNL